MLIFMGLIQTRLRLHKTHFAFDCLFFQGLFPPGMSFYCWGVLFLAGFLPTVGLRMPLQDAKGDLPKPGFLPQIFQPQKERKQTLEGF